MIVIVSSLYLVEVKLAHERTGEGVVVVHRHDNRSRMGRRQHGGEGLEDTKRQPTLLNVALLGLHQFFSERLLQGQRDLAGRGAVPAGVRL